MDRNFNVWFSTFRKSIANYSYYTDFEKVYKNVDKIKVELNILNSLIGSKNIETDFVNLIKKYPEVLKCIPIILAIRSYEIYCQDANGSKTFNFKKYDNCNINDYIYFMKNTGIFDLLQNHIINNLIDYITGVEVGLGTNGRKNRGGDLMENLIEEFIQKSGFIKEVNYFKEMTSNEIKNKWTIDLSHISNQYKSIKKFDYVIKTDNIVYGIECNFYTSGGSKLNETARSYKNISIESNNINNFSFIWFTDGNGWKKAKNNLEEAFDVIEHIYNITDLENGILNQIII